MSEISKALDAARALRSSMSSETKETPKSPGDSTKNMFEQRLMPKEKLTICQLEFRVIMSVNSFYRPDTEEIRVTSLQIFLGNGANAGGRILLPGGIYTKEDFCKMYKYKASGKVWRSRGNPGGIRGGGEGEPQGGKTGHGSHRLPLGSNTPVA